MAAVIPLPARAGESKGLLYWMERVLRERERVLAAPDEDAIHDLRVALRRCRTLARVFEEVDPHPAWRGLRKASRKLFRSLGAIRDSHVQESWIVKLSAQDDPLRAQLLYALKAGRERQERDAKRSATRFDETAWAKLAVALRPRVKLLAADEPAAHCLALERLEEAGELHRRALRTERAKPWHALRIGIKHFRYVVENLLPKRHITWGADLKRVQDLLGDVHDLDVLTETVRATADSSGLEHWQETIERERGERIATYRQLTLGATSLWNQWRLGLPTNGHVAVAADARLHATARAADPRLRKSAGTARLAKTIFKQLQRADASPFLKEPKLEIVLRAAALLHGIDPRNSHGSAHKDARKFLSELPAPPGWSADQWQLLALAIRYHRGAAPSSESGRFANLEPAQQAKLLSIVGILRIARALRKAGVDSGARVRVEGTADSIAILIDGFLEGQIPPKGLARGRQMLEGALGKSVTIRAMEKQTLSLPLEFPSPKTDSVAIGE
jgi:CHAD domain-containing protein